MSGTLNSQAIKLANSIVQRSLEAITLYQEIVAIDAAWNDIGAANVFAAMSTSAVNPDGRPGAADATPNAAHPIDTLVYPVMAQAISSTQLAQAKTILDALRSLIESQAVPAQGGARAILNAMVNG